MPLIQTKKKCFVITVGMNFKSNPFHRELPPCVSMLTLCGGISAISG